MSNPKFVQFIVILICATSTISCDQQNLGDGYYFLPKYEATDIGYPYGSIVYKSELKNSFQDVKIFAEISEIAHNKRYIIVCQQPNKKIMADLIKSDILFWSKNYLENKKDSLIKIGCKKMSLKNIYDLSIENNTEILNRKIANIIDDPSFCGYLFKRKENFYIIDKNNDSIFGPLEHKDFTTLLAEKKVNLEF